MSDESTKSLDVKDVVIRICPACGVVNPAGPSETCPHVQLARFDGLNDGMAALLGNVAKARRRFTDLVDELRKMVLESIQNHEAEVETTHKANFNEVENITKGHHKAPVLNLENTEPPPATPRKKRRKRRPPQPPPVDPRQLELIAQEPAKGDA
ncbi:MAG: hypothetical protein GY854_32245 [Deltaproteobacteria bacterium]|nr:hypothetical protein [Deltaproteobacteria bacterium]